MNYFVSFEKVLKNAKVFYYAEKNVQQKFYSNNVKAFEHTE